MPVELIDLSKWYWLADDGRVFSAERGLIVDDTDPEYLDWLTTHSPGTWARDIDGNQTEASLLTALAPHGIGISLLAYAEQKLLERDLGGFLLEGTRVGTSDRDKHFLFGARLAVMIDPGWTTPYVTDTGEILTITSVEITAISDGLLEHMRECLTIFAAVKLEIIAGTITTKAEIDTAFV